MKGRKQRNGKRGPRGWKTGCMRPESEPRRVLKKARYGLCSHYKCDLNMNTNFLFDYDLNINYDFKARPEAELMGL